MKKQKFLSTALFICLLLVGSVATAQTYETIFTETMGATQVINNMDVASFTDFDNQSTCTYSALNAKVSKSNTSDYAVASSGNNVFLAATTASATEQTTYFQISGISTSGYSDIELTFGFRKEANATLLSDIDIEYSTDGTTWFTIVPTYWTRLKSGVTTGGIPSEMPTTSSTGWYFITCAAASNDIPTVANLSLRFKKVGVNAIVRFDDIELSGIPTGAPPAPALSINSPANNSTFLPCDSIQFVFTLSNFDLYNTFSSIGDGYLKINSDVLPLLSPMLSNEYYVGSLEYSVLSVVLNQKFLLPVGEYDFTMTLVDRNRNPLVPNVAQTIYFTVAATPLDVTISPNGGTFTEPQTVALTSSNDEAAIYYTLDGSTPDASSTLFTDAFTLYENTTVSAIAIDANGCYLNSAVDTAIFAIDTTTPSLPDPIPSFPIFTETFGTPAVTNNPDVNVYDNYDNQSNYIFSGRDASIRQTTPSIDNNGNPQYYGASGQNLVFLNKDSSYFLIEGINTNGYRQIGLSFGFHKYAQATSLSDLTIEYSTDGTVWSPIAMTDWTRLSNVTYGPAADFPVGTGSTGWYYITCAPDSNTIPQTNNLAIRFTEPVQMQIRLDDIKMFAYEVAPQVAIVSPQDNAEFGPCDQITFDLTLTNFDFYSEEIPTGGQIMFISNLFSQLPVEAAGDTLICDEETFDAVYDFMHNQGITGIAAGSYNFKVVVLERDAENNTFVPSVSDEVHFTVTEPTALNVTIAPNGGEFNAPQTVTISASAENVVIYYTVDGTEPTEESTVYTEAFVVNHGETTVMAIAVDENGCYYPSALEEATFNIDTTAAPVDPGTGISEMTVTTFTISPNPATDVLNISGTGFSQVEILNFLGQVVDAQQVTNGTVQINIAHLNAGVYFLRAKGNAVVTKKFIKK